MNSPRSMAVLAPVFQALSPARRWLEGLDARERRAVGLAAWVVGAALVWLVAVQPAWRTLRQAPARLAEVEQQLQSMQAQAADARSLRALPPVPRAQALVALRAASERLEGASLVEQGDRARLTLNGSSSERLRAWLLEVRTSARARPVEVNLTRDERGLSGTVVVALDAGPAR